ncbi:MAG TPA: hypothetical protein VGS05_00415 [Candidatus Sulfotelmatobacter sp.]|nr:hypothetical protein [Candidatus Sulfotelmatobacter sp.]
MATTHIPTDETDERLNSVLREIYETYGRNLGDFLLNLPDEPESNPEPVVEQSISILKKRA